MRDEMLQALATNGGVVMINFYPAYIDEGARDAGRAYFVGQEQPVLLWEWINDLLRRLNVPPVQKTISEKVAYRVGAVLETAWRILPLSGEPPMTRFVATQLARSHSYDMEPAKRDFGYEELVPMDVAMERTVEDLLRRGLSGREPFSQTAATRR